jgi:hypothetical protein
MEVEPKEEENTTFERLYEVAEEALGSKTKGGMNIVGDRTGGKRI